MDIDSARAIVFLSVLGIMLIVETLFPERPWSDGRLKRLAVHGAVAGINTALTRFLAAAPLLLLAEAARARNWGLAGLLGLSGWAELIATVIVLDCLDYWWHRLNHKISFLWRFHRVHHLDTHVDATTSLRFHFGELLLSGVAKASWILLWGPSLLGFAIFEAGITAYAQFHHSNIDFPEPIERALRWVHMTPRLHAAHHTVTLRTRDANFSTIFLAWDHLFGTFQEADREELKTLGLPEGRDSSMKAGALLLSPFMGRT